VKVLWVVVVLAGAWAQQVPPQSAPARRNDSTKKTPESGKLMAVAGAAQQVAIAESAIRNARLNGDADTLAKFLAPGFIATMPTGEVLERGTYLDGIKRAARLYYKIELSEMQVHRFGPYLYVVTAREDVAGKPTANDKDAGNDFSRSFRYTRIWQKQAAGWQAVAYQASEINGK